MLNLLSMSNRNWGKVRQTSRKPRHITLSCQARDIAKSTITVLPYKQRSFPICNHRQFDRREAMSKLIIIAGPQAAGKSTLIQKLGTQPHTVAPLFAATKPILFPLQESRQIISHQYMLMGAIHMTPEHEHEVVKCDLNRMDLILKKP